MRNSPGMSVPGPGVTQPDPGTLDRLVGVLR